LDLFNDFQKGKIDIDEALKLAKDRRKSQSDKSVANIADSDSDGVSDNVIENDGDGDGETKMDLHIVANKFLKETNVIQAFIESHKLKSKIELIEKMREFHLHLKKERKTTKTLPDYSKHLDSWLNLKNQRKKADQEIPVGGFTAADVNRIYGKIG